MTRFKQVSGNRRAHISQPDESYFHMLFLPSFKVPKIVSRRFTFPSRRCPACRNTTCSRACPSAACWSTICLKRGVRSCRFLRGQFPGLRLPLFVLTKVRNGQIEVRATRSETALPQKSDLARGRSVLVRVG